MRIAHVTHPLKVNHTLPNGRVETVPNSEMITCSKVAERTGVPYLYSHVVAVVGTSIMFHGTVHFVATWVCYKWQISTYSHLDLRRLVA